MGRLREPSFRIPFSHTPLRPDMDGLIDQQGSTERSANHHPQTTPCKHTLRRPKSTLYRERQTTLGGCILYTALKVIEPMGKATTIIGSITPAAAPRANSIVYKS